MTSAVLDTNAIVSATLFESGPSGRIWQAAHDRRFTLITSEWIIGEVVRALNRDRIQRKYQVRARDVARVRTYLERQVLMTPLTREVHGVASHPEDDLILATADSADADYLVTGDRQLQGLKTYKRVKIVSPREFLQILEEQGEGQPR